MLYVIQELCHICDILLLQETWLYDIDLSLCNSVHMDFYGQGLSSVNTSSGLSAGRPYGGLPFSGVRVLVFLVKLILMMINVSWV